MKKRPFQLNLPRFTERLNMMKSSNIDLLSKETTRLLGLQIDTLNEALQTNNFLNTAPPASDAKEKQETRVEEFKAWISHLQNEQ
ncbi:MAG: hypothetical protein Q8Q54_11515 [Methylococcales bacterium]|nr:hypothetical protein [Methylococcales bacterium]